MSVRVKEGSVYRDLMGIFLEERKGSLVGYKSTNKKSTFVLILKPKNH